MNRFCALTWLLLTAPVMAAVYKGIGPDGRVFYSDRPIADAQPVELTIAPAVAEVAEPEPDLAFTGAYDRFEILVPSDGTTLHQPETDVVVSLLINPPPQSEHRLLVEINGAPITGIGTSTQFVVHGLPHGSHRLLARLLDEEGVPVAIAPTVRFNLLPSAPDEDEDPNLTR